MLFLDSDTSAGRRFARPYNVDWHFGRGAGLVYTSPISTAAEPTHDHHPTRRLQLWAALPYD